ncbi:alpha/beta fold hydrolase [Spongisporangium articulatum]|uniref:Alpha/beta fold hydrolase n=1 Tax=Spongisporangium articulatum TaxID=3362603 RepID=A0ABW8AM24_9ACTN
MRPGPQTAWVDGPDGPARVLVWPAEPVLGGDAPPGATLLAFHGWTDSADVFAPLAAALDPRHALVAVDAPGHGETPLPAGDYDVPRHALSGIAVYDALPRLVTGGRPSAGRVVAYGHSMGALTAARVAMARGVRGRGARRSGVVSLVLEDPARTTLRRPSSPAGMRTWLTGLRSGTHTDRVAWARANHPTWPAAELDPWAASKSAVDLAEFDRRHDWGEPLPVLLAEVHCPVLLIRGETALGGIVSTRAAARCEAACPGGLEVLTLPAGHSPRREAPEAFAAALNVVLRGA